MQIHTASDKVILPDWFANVAECAFSEEQQIRRFPLLTATDGCDQVNALTCANDRILPFQAEKKEQRIASERLKLNPNNALTYTLWHQ